MSVTDLAGWVGGALGALAYVLVSTRRIVAHEALFQSLNMAGAALLSIASFHSGALPSACVNIAWVGFGLHSLTVSSARRRRLVRLTVITDEKQRADRADACVPAA